MVAKCKRWRSTTLESGVDIKRRRRKRSPHTPLFSEMPWSPIFEILALSFGIVLFKKLINHSRATFVNLWSKSYAFQNKAKIMWKCAKRGHLTNLLCSFGVSYWVFAPSPKILITTPRLESIPKDNINVCFNIMSCKWILWLVSGLVALG